MSRGEPVAFVDAREEQSWAAAGERVTGAVRVRLPSIVRDATRVPQGRPVVVYGSDEHEADVPRVADALRALGFGEVRILAGGFAAWQALHGPVQRNDGDPASA
jgi:rhodanese-related sulfurtransferase